MFEVRNSNQLQNTIWEAKFMWALHALPQLNCTHKRSLCLFTWQAWLPTDAMITKGCCSLRDTVTCVRGVIRITVITINYQNWNLIFALMQKPFPFTYLHEQLHFSKTIKEAELSLTSYSLPHKGSTLCQALLRVFGWQSTRFAKKAVLGMIGNHILFCFFSFFKAKSLFSIWIIHNPKRDHEKYFIQYFSLICKHIHDHKNIDLHFSIHFFFLLIDEHCFLFSIRSSKQGSWLIHHNFL